MIIKILVFIIIILTIIEIMSLLATRYYNQKLKDMNEGNFEDLSRDNVSKHLEG